MAEPTGEENVHPGELKNEYPTGVLTAFSTGIDAIQRYGWFILAGVVLLLYLRKRYASTIDQWQRSREEENYKKYDTSTSQSRLEAMERSRQKMQERLDAQAQEQLEKQKKKEEEKRKQKIDDWEGHLEGKGYKSKYKPNEEDSTSSSSLPKPKPKKPLRDNDYNPLTGGAGASYYRPPRRGNTGGG